MRRFRVPLQATFDFDVFVNAETQADAIRYARENLKKIDWADGAENFEIHEDVEIYLDEGESEEDLVRKFIGKGLAMTSASIVTQVLSRETFHLYQDVINGNIPDAKTDAKIRFGEATFFNGAKSYLEINNGKLNAYWKDMNSDPVMLEDVWYSKYNTRFLINDRLYSVSYRESDVHEQEKVIEADCIRLIDRYKQMQKGA